MSEIYFDYKLEDYNFTALFQKLFETKDLQKIHKNSNKDYDFFAEPGKDSDTIFHKKFYDKMRTGWPEFLDLYKKFIKEVIIPKSGIKDPVIYQKWPSFRVHLPNNVAVGGWHKDSDYNHPVGEINFIVAITPMFESNTTISESTPGKMDFKQFTLNPGQVVMFDGNQCIHGNLPNKTGVTRISFDLRLLKKKDYNENHSLKSLSKGNKFLIGHYYEELN